MNTAFFREVLREGEEKLGWVGVQADPKRQIILDTWVRANLLSSETVKEDADPFHVTVKYGLHTRNPCEVKEVIRQYPKSLISAVLTSISLFVHEAQDVVKVGVDSPDLHLFNQILSTNLKVTDTFPKYDPHLTLAYVKTGYGKQYAGSDVFAGQVLVFKEVFFSDAEGNITTFLLE